MAEKKTHTIRTPLQLQANYDKSVFVRLPQQSGERCELDAPGLKLVFTCEACKKAVPLLDMMNVAWNPEREEGYFICKHCQWAADHSDGDKIPYTWELESLVRAMLRDLDRRRAGKAKAAR